MSLDIPNLTPPTLPVMFVAQASTDQPPALGTLGGLRKAPVKRVFALPVNHSKVTKSLIGLTFVLPPIAYILKDYIFPPKSLDLSHSHDTASSSSIIIPPTSNSSSEESSWLTVPYLIAGAVVSVAVIAGVSLGINRLCAAPRNKDNQGLPNPSDELRKRERRIPTDSTKTSARTPRYTVNWSKSQSPMTDETTKKSGGGGGSGPSTDTRTSTEYKRSSSSTKSMRSASGSHSFAEGKSKGVFAICTDRLSHASLTIRKIGKSCLSRVSKCFSPPLIRGSDRVLGHGNDKRLI